MAGAADLLPVLLGGLLTLGGGVIASGATWFSNSRRDASEKQAKHADKFEQLVAAVYEFDHWLELKQDVIVFAHDDKIGPSPFYRIESISAVYFPILLPKITLLKVAAHGVNSWINKAALKRHNNQIDALQEGLLESYNPYLQARDALLTDVIEQAKREFQ